MWTRDGRGTAVAQKAFTPRRAALRPRAEEAAARLLDELAARGGAVDLLGAYARPLPIAVLCELLGIPAADREWIAVTVASYDERSPGPHGGRGRPRRPARAAWPPDPCGAASG